VCFAVGYDTGIETALLDRATGKLASGQSVLAYSGDGELYGVACSSATLCVAVGADGAGNTVTWALALRSAVFTKQPPSKSKAGSSFTVKVSVVDSSGNVVTSDDTDSVTLAITSGTGAPGADLSCSTNPVTVSKGVASFTCSVNMVGTGYTLSATSEALAPATSSAFNVT
jgi:hypothetical protein